jgi:hypothetical protein
MGFLDTFKVSMMDIVHEAKRNPELADELMDKLFEWLDDELITRSNFELVYQSLTDINNHLIVVSNNFKTEADSNYACIKPEDGKLKEDLIFYCSHYLRAISLENFPEACRRVFQQIETLVNFLLKKRSLVEKASLDASFLTRVKITRQAGKPLLLPLYAKIAYIDIHYKAEFDTHSIRYDSLKSFTYSIRENYDKCYALRNFASHGTDFYKDSAENLILEEFKLQATRYLKAPLQLVDVLKSIYVRS